MSDSSPLDDLQRAHTREAIRLRLRQTANHRYLSEVCLAASMDA